VAPPWIFDESQLVDSDGDGQAQEFAEVATFTEPAYVFDDLTIPRRGIWSVHNTEVRDTIAYSSWYSHGVVAWDLSTINSPVQVGQYRPPARRGWPEVWGVAFDPESGVVYLSDLVGGLWVLRVPLRHSDAILHPGPFTRGTGRHVRDRAGAMPGLRDLDGRSGQHQVKEPTEPSGTSRNS
jgi:hypothetical protein